MEGEGKSGILLRRGGGSAVPQFIVEKNRPSQVAGRERSPLGEKKKSKKKVGATLP